MKIHTNKIYALALFIAGVSISNQAQCMDMKEQSVVTPLTKHHQPQFNDCNDDILNYLSQFLDQETFESFSSLSKRTYLIWLFSQGTTTEIAQENKQRGYQDWHDLPEFTPQRTYWVNNHAFEVLGLYMNMKANRGCAQDISRFDLICNRFKSSPLPKNSVVMQYVNFLSYDTMVIFRKLAQACCDFPDLALYKTKEGHDNAKALYLFHTYLLDEIPNIQGLSQDPLSLEIKGPMGDFIRNQAILHPIRVNLAKEESMGDDLVPLVTVENIRDLVLLDPGITRKDMAHILEIICWDINDQKYKDFLSQDCLGKLAKYVIKYDLSDNFKFNRKWINLYRKKASKEVFAKIMDFSLRSMRKIWLNDLYGNYSRDEFHKKLYSEAITLFTNLGWFDLAEYHENQRIQDIEEKRVKKENEAKLRKSSWNSGLEDRKLPRW